MIYHWSLPVLALPLGSHGCHTVLLLPILLDVWKMLWSLFFFNHRQWQITGNITGSEYHCWRIVDQKNIGVNLNKMNTILRVRLVNFFRKTKMNKTKQDKKQVFWEKKCYAQPYSEGKIVDCSQSATVKFFKLRNCTPENFPQSLLISKLGSFS